MTEQDKENLVELYYSTLHKETKPGLHIAKFFWESFGKEPKKADIIMFNKLVKLYGRNDVFFSVLDLHDVDSLNLDRIYGLLVFILKKRIRNKSSNGEQYDDLTSLISSMKRKIKRGIS